MKESIEKKDKDEINENKKDKFDDNENKDYEEACTVAWSFEISLWSLMVFECQVFFFCHTIIDNWGF